MIRGATKHLKIEHGFPQCYTPLFSRASTPKSPVPEDTARALREYIFLSLFLSLPLFLFLFLTDAGRNIFYRKTRRNGRKGTRKGRFTQLPPPTQAHAKADPESTVIPLKETAVFLKKLYSLQLKLNRTFLTYLFNSL